MKRTFGTLLAVLAAGAVAAEPAAPKRFIQAEKKEYRRGEEIVFKVTRATPEEMLEYTVSNAPGAETWKPLEGDTIRFVADRPSFVLAKIACPGDRKKTQVPAGAAVEPEKLTADTPLPADFDAFWDGEVARQRAEKIEVVSCREVKALRSGVCSYDLHLRRGTLEVTAFLSIPEGVSAAKPGPGMVFFNGASKVNADLKVAENFAARYGIVSCNVNFHAMENLPVIPLKLQAERRRAVRDYQYKSASDRDAYYPKSIFLRALLAVDYLASRPEVKGGGVGVQGGSLGGAQALSASALAPDKVRFCIATVPAMSNHFGADSKNRPGWPNLLAKVPEARNTAPYFDTVNFAHRIHCPVLISAGYVDETVPPASVYALYSRLNQPKKIVGVQFAGHGPSLLPKHPSALGAGGAERQEWIRTLILK